MKVSDEMMLSALLKHGSQSGAAKALGINRSTISKRLEREDFKKRYESAKDEAYVEAVAVMKMGLGDAVKVLHRVMTNPNNAETVRVQAADAYLRHSLRYVESADLLRRIQRVEEASKRIAILEGGGGNDEKS